MDHDYARRKLTTLLRDVNNYTADEFWRQMSRIAAGATGQAHAEDLKAERDALAFQNKNREGLVRRAIEKEEQYDALAAHVEAQTAELSACQSILYQLARAGEVTPQYADDAKRVLSQKPPTSLDRRDARVAAKAMREIAEWMDPDSEKFSGPTYHEAEMIGMEISGPTFCSDARRCMKAGNRAFLEAARIWEYNSHQAEAGAA
ncbi:hypothetical protein [Onishia taeanensis]|nr:hypothetical protein [Halomonas taeanensis]